MRLKVDENLPGEACDLLNRAGHDAIRVGQQGVSGADDALIFQLCQSEQRALITLDVGFANVLRLGRQDKQRVLDPVASTLPVLEREPLDRRLWIVEDERIRIRA
jgi:predicted nuclease of predicted toxin-antitoxin system